MQKFKKKYSNTHARTGLNGSVLLFILFLFFPSALFAEQPYEIVKKDIAGHFIRQGPSMCGYTSFYYVFNYYGDSHHLPPFFYDKEGKVVDLYETIPMVKANPGQKKYYGRFTANAKIARWISPTKAPPLWSQLREGAENLYIKDPKDHLKKYYPYVLSNDKAVKHTKKGLQKKERMFEKNVIPELLNNHPVIVHLRRNGMVSGHYIVLVGYNKKEGIVYYLDPNSNEKDSFMQKVNEQAFIREKWYTGTSSTSWKKADWDGKWLTFYR